MCEVTQGLTYRPDMHEGLVGKRHEVFNRPAMCKGMWRSVHRPGVYKGFVCTVRTVCRMHILCSSLPVCV